MQLGHGGILGDFLEEVCRGGRMTVAGLGDPTLELYRLYIPPPLSLKPTVHPRIPPQEQG